MRLTLSLGRAMDDCFFLVHTILLLLIPVFLSGELILGNLLQRLKVYTVSFILLGILALLLWQWPDNGRRILLFGMWTLSAYFKQSILQKQHITPMPKWY